MRQAIRSGFSGSVASPCTAAGDEVIIEFLDPAARVIADSNVNDEADQYCAGIDSHLYCSFIV